MRRSVRLPLEELAPALLTPPASPGPLDWRTVFGNARPVELEVGFGKGLFLLTAALACPEVNFVGLEILRKYQLFTANRVCKRGLANVRLICGDARLFLRDYLCRALCRRFMSIFRIRGGRNGTTSGECSRRSSQPSANVCWVPGDGCMSLRMSRITSRSWRHC